MINSIPARFATTASVLSLFVTSAAAADDRTRRAEPLTKTSAVITIEDYPEESIRHKEQGMTSISFEVDERGRVTRGSCVVEATSDFPRLDKQTCAVAERRFRFKPALQDGRPVKERRSQSVYWSMGARDPGGFADEAIRMVHSSARCVVDTEPDIARRIVDLPLGSSDQDAAVNSIDGDALKCLRRDGDLRLNFLPGMLVGPLAEALYQARFARTAPPALHAGATPLAPRTAIEAIAQCIVRRHPGHVVELIATVPTGPDEAAAVRRILPDLQPCITAGATLRLNRMAIRNLVATALYREAMHAAGVGADPGS